MKIIKLNAIDSTNTFLKSLNQNQIAENFTVVTAISQFEGKGQMGSKWLSEDGKNIIMSVLVKNIPFDINAIFTLNVVVTNVIINVLKNYKIPNLSIKWPNDILAGNKKIGGILIENAIKDNSQIDSIIGIGINVNQTIFENLTKASSLQLVTHKVFNIEEIITKIALEIEHIFTSEILEEKINEEWDFYHSNLFKIKVPAVFEKPDRSKLMGIIQGVTKEGKLKIEHENDLLKEYNIKEIALIY